MLERYLNRGKVLKHGRQKEYERKIHIQKDSGDYTHCGQRIWSNKVVGEDDVKEFYTGMCHNCYLAWEKKCKKFKKVLTVQVQCESMGLGDSLI